MTQSTESLYRRELEEITLQFFDNLLLTEETSKEETPSMKTPSHFNETAGGFLFLMLLLAIALLLKLSN